MAEISQNVNIEMLEKLPDGTYKRKYPKTRSDTGVTFDEHLAEFDALVESNRVELATKGNLKSTIHTNITVPTTAWVTNTCPDFEQEEKIDFPFMAEISIPGVLATDSGETKYKYADEISGNFGNSATQDGKVVLTAKEKPTQSITLLWVRIDRRLG